MHSSKRNRLSSARAAKLVYISHNLTLHEQPKRSESAIAHTCKESSTKAKVAAHFSEPAYSGPSSAAASTSRDYMSAAPSEEDETSESSIEVSLHDSFETDSEESVVE